MLGLAGSVATSQTGVYETLTPIARSSSPIARPTRLGEVGVARSTQRHVAREWRRVFAQGEELPAFLVGRDQQRRG